jgi:glutamate 5-kinase
MRTKLDAAKIATASGIPMVLMNGLRGDDCLADFFLKGEDQGSWFLPRKEAAVKGRHRWMAFTAHPQGILLVDAGAREALVHHPRSLLASGVKGVEGNFRQGDLVSVCESARHREFARGIVRYSHDEISKIKGMKSDAISAVLGRKAQEVIHRDQLVILRGPE